MVISCTVELTADAGAVRALGHGYQWRGAEASGLDCSPTHATACNKLHAAEFEGDKRRSNAAHPISGSEFARNHGHHQCFARSTPFQEQRPR